MMVRVLYIVLTIRFSTLPVAPGVVPGAIGLPPGIPATVILARVVGMGYMLMG
jgi:hypothetical protein